MKPFSLSLIARKGGVGKTVIAWHIAGEYAARGRKVLAIDLDGQASLTRTCLGAVDADALDPMKTSGMIFAGGQPMLSDLLQETPHENLSLIPCGPFIDEYQNGDSPDLLTQFVAQALEDFDLVIFDTPPNTNAWPTRAAIALSSLVLSPVAPDSYGAQSISDVMHAIDRDGEPSALRFFINLFQPNKLNREYVEAIRSIHGDLVYDTEISNLIAYRNAIHQRSHAAPNSKAAKRIAVLVDEIDQTIHPRRKKQAA